MNKEKEELNRWCHTVLLGNDWNEHPDLCVVCNKPEDAHPIGGDRFMPPPQNPDYTPSLDLASIVEAKAIERVARTL